MAMHSSTFISIFPARNATPQSPHLPPPPHHLTVRQSSAFLASYAANKSMTFSFHPLNNNKTKEEKKAPTKGSTRCLCLWFFSFPFRSFFFVLFFQTFLEQEELG